MKRTLLIFVFAAAALQAQISVQAGKQAQVPVPGATSAVSLDSGVADASVADGVMTIRGVSAGDTRVVAARWNGLQEFRVHVIPPPPAYPPGFVPPRLPGAESGSFAVRFNSDRLQFENSLDLYSQSGDRVRQLHVVSATVAGGVQVMSYVPSAYYRLATRTVDVTLLDQTVDNSPLTIRGTVLRGLHVKDGPWQFHGGYTASADFADVILPTEKEIAAGISYTKKLDRFLRITPNVYFVRSSPVAGGPMRAGWIGSVLFESQLLSGWTLKNEIAYGGGTAFASELDHSGSLTTLKARLVEKSVDFPSIRSYNLPGLFGDFSWSQKLSGRFNLQSGGAINRIDLNAVRQKTENGYGNLRYRISRSWSVSSGATYGSFSSPGVYSATTLALPQQVGFDRASFGAGFQYQYSRASNSFAHGNGYRQTVRFTVGRLTLGEFADYQDDALSISALFSQVPGLQRELQQLGLVAVTPEQLSSLLQQTAFLQSLGLASGSQIVTVPHRLQEGGNLTWDSGSARPHRLSLFFVRNDNLFPTYSSRSWSLTGTYSKDVGTHNQIQASWSFMQSGVTGQHQLTPVFSVSFRHTFSSAPPFFSAQGHGSISGTVFIDAKRQGSYETGMEALDRAVVVLDDQRTAVTDRFGHFRFDHVATGDHRIQMKYASNRRHYCTTPDETVVTANSTINFGIAFSTLDLWGYVQDDAGNGLDNVTLQVSGPAGATTLATDHSGKFWMDGVQPGEYQIQVRPETVAIGYATEQLNPIDVSVTAESSGHPVLKIPANRVLTGAVTVYEPASGSYVPLAGATVLVAKINKRTKTNSAGRFTVGGLPAGEVEITVSAGRSTLTHTINVPVHPVTLREDFRVSSLNGQIASTIAGGSQ